MMHLIAGAVIIASTLAALTIGSFKLPTIQSIIQSVTQPTKTAPAPTTAPTKPTVTPTIKTVTPSSATKPSPSAVKKITVLSPNGGEVWNRGETKAVSWSTQGFSATSTVKVGIFGNGVGGCILSQVVASLGTVNVGTTHACLSTSTLITGQYKIYLTIQQGNASATDQSDNFFTINSLAGSTATTTTFVAALGKALNGNTTANLEWHNPTLTNAQLSFSCPATSTNISVIKFWNKESNTTFDCTNGILASYSNQQFNTLSLEAFGNTQPVQIPFTLKLFGSGGSAQAPTSQKGVAILFPRASSTPTMPLTLEQIRQNIKISAASPLNPTQVGVSPFQTAAIFKVTNNNTSPIYLGSFIQFLNTGSTSTPQSFDLFSSGQNGGMGDLAVRIATQSTSTSGTASPAFNVLVAEQYHKINGGGWKYLTIKTRQQAQNNDTFKISTGDLSNIRLYVKEIDFGQSLDSNSTIDTIFEIYPSGSPTSTATVTAKT